VSNIYKYCWENGIKGVTIYRQGSRDIEVLSVGVAEKPIEERPRVLLGRTYHFQSGCGELFVTINDLNDKPFEVFTFTNGGGCQAFAEGLARAVHAGLSSGADPLYIAKHLSKVKCMVASRKDCDGKSCADIIGKAIREAVKTSVVEVQKGATTPPPKESKASKCPICGSDIQTMEGCWTCHSCGESGCS
jgi:ribonucleoside-diphosphate reductase alpha chain